MKKEKSCGCIVFNEKNQILLVHQNTGHWGLPKGHVEPGETEIQTAKREVKEETNIDVELNEKFRYTMVYNPKEDVEKEVVFFIAKSINNKQIAQLKEISEVKWFEFDKAIETITYDNSKELLKKVRKDLKEDKKC